jgi:hypothetical protein
MVFFPYFDYTHTPFFNKDKMLHEVRGKTAKKGSKHYILWYDYLVNTFCCIFPLQRNFLLLKFSKFYKKS